MMSEKIFWHVDAAIEYDVDGQAVIFNKKTGNTHVLNPTAARIYQLCEDMNADKIAELFAEESHNCSLAEIQEDVGHMIDDFIDAGLIVKAKL